MKRLVTSSLSLAALLCAACSDPAAGGARGSDMSATGPSGMVPPGATQRPDGTWVDADGDPIDAPPGPGVEDDPTFPGAVPSDDVIDEPAAAGGGPSGPGVDGPGAPVDVDDLPDSAEPVSTNDVFLGSRLRRLTNAEYANTLFDLFGVQIDVAALPHDTRQTNFTRNIAQAVDPVLGGHLQRVAQEVASTVVASNLSTLAPCASNGDQACARSFLEDFGARIYRRPLASEEIDGLLALYDAGAEGQTNAFASGMQTLLEGMLQSASFLYVSEMGGTGSPGDIVVLDAFETAASLSYLLTGHPPDDELWALAADGTLLEPDIRRAQAERLLGAPGAEEQIRRFVKEWLKLDSVATVDKADDRFANLRGPVEDEANRFISAILVNGDGRLSTMLSSGYTYVGPEMAQFYGVQPDSSGRADLSGTGRVGLLQLASFLAANSQNDESGPIKRGVAVLRKVLCYDLLDPAEAGVQNVMPPPRDPTLTTRERFAAHASGDCATCHAFIDPIGFTFENFDAIGAVRAMDNGKPVDTSGALALGLDSDGPLTDSVDLANKLAAEPRVAECFARHVYRNGMANAEEDAEETFIRGVSGSEPITDDVRALLIELSGSNSFLLRRLPTTAEQL